MTFSHSNMPVQTCKQGLNNYPQYHPIKLLSGPWQVYLQCEIMAGCS